MTPQSAHETPTSLYEGLNLNGWIIEHPIARTDLSELWKVRNQFATKQVAALKIIAEELMQNEDMLARFVQEIDVLTRLNYPHVPRPMGHFAVQPRYAVLTQWIDGPTLGKIIEQHPSGMEIAEIARVSIPILRTLHQLHTQNPQLIHRDIKPLNIMVESATQKPFLIDFGISLVRGNPRLSRYGMIVGSPHYMAPEMIQRQFEVGHSVDIYAFGIMLFEMATGRKPFDSSHEDWFEFLRDIQNQHIYSQPPWVEDFRPGIPADFELLVQKAIEKDPVKRWLTCEEMAEMLQTFLPEAPLPPPPPPPPPPERRKRGEGEQQPLVVVTDQPVAAQRISKWLRLLLSPGVFILLGLPLAVDPRLQNVGGIVLAVFGLIASFGGYLGLIYRAWEAIQGDETGVTPKRVVAEHFYIPWATWQYLAGFGNHYNAFIESQGYDLPYMGSAISNLLVFLPFVLFAVLLLPAPQQGFAGVLLVALISVVYLMVAGRICDAINDIREYRANMADALSQEVNTL